MANSDATPNPAGQKPLRRLWIHNDGVEAEGGETFATVNPANGEVLARVASGDRADVDRAVASSREAFQSSAWGGLDGHRRGRLLAKLADLIETNADELATLETQDNGKPFFESRKVDLPMVVRTFRYFAGMADKIHGETIPVSGPFLHYTQRSALGVVGCIVPWNFPLNLASWKVAPALACGNSVVLKPAEQTPLTALRLGELAAEAGFPPGALNVVPGFGDRAGAALVEHPDVAAISFTGSTETGRLVMKGAAGTLKRISLELGGKSPNVIFADADLQAAIRGATSGIFYGTGEVCAAGSRILVERSVYDEVLEGLQARARKMTVGDPMDSGTRLGAIVSETQLERVLGYIQVGKDEGARLLTGGARREVEGRGFFVEATVFADVEPEMTIAQEEIFGPVAAVIPFDDFGEAVERANKTIYGLASGIWTRDVGKAHRMAQAIDAGIVWVNTYNRYDPASPFGGTKASGFGADLGFQAAVEKYTRSKSVWVALD
jgi:acyl-CoA reductase-like NAD-dependent aldehyde dehydrogenase